MTLNNNTVAMGKIKTQIYSFPSFLPSPFSDLRLENTFIFNFQIKGRSLCKQITTTPLISGMKCNYAFPSKFFLL